MSRMEALSDAQRQLVADHIHIVKWAIYDHIEVNETLCGFGYDDLFQEGCLCLCMERQSGIAYEILYRKT